jgi:ATP synthase F1 gamma subunit
MQKASAIQVQLDEIVTIKELTDVFESLSSTQIAKIKDKVEYSTSFFERLWRIYGSLRLDPKSRITYTTPEDGPNGKKRVFIIISADAGLSGDIDDRLVEAVLEDYNAADTDIVIVGQHGASQLHQRGLTYQYFFKAPESENFVDVSPILAIVAPYPQITVYYEAYLSLGSQKIKKIDLIASVRQMSENINPDETIISDYDTVFEPSLDEIIDRIEVTMVGLALSQVILMSSLAQYASRFNAMVMAKRRALQMALDYRLDFYRAKRSENDKRLREMMVGLKKRKRAEAKGER